MKFEDKLLKLLNKALSQGADFDFTEFRLNIPCDNDGGDHYIIKSNNRFYLMDSINYAESMMMEDDHEL